MECECKPCLCSKEDEKRPCCSTTSDKCFCVLMPSCFVGRPAPSFQAEALFPDGSFQKMSLSSFKGQYLVLFFYPLDFTFVCPTEIIAFSDRISEFRSRNTEVVAASCDSTYSHLAWTKVPRKTGGLGELQIPIIADKNGLIAKNYGIYIEEQGISLRGLFIIDPNGILRQIIVNDLPVGRSVDETLRLVDAYQFTDSHGEVCPINWKKGDKSLDTTKSSQFFSERYK